MSAVAYVGGRVARGAIVVRDLFLAGVVVVVVAPLWLLPREHARALGRLYGRAAFLCWPLGRRVGMINLRRAYGSSMTAREAARFIRDVFVNIGQNIAEVLQFARRYQQGAAGNERFYEMEDPALEARVLADPRPKVFVTGHLGCWEIATMVAGYRVGNNGAAIARRIDNSFVDALVRSIRFRNASQLIEKRGAVTEAMRRLRAGHSIALLLDENAGYRGVFVDFFRRPASTGKLAALLSLMNRAPVVLGAVVRNRNDQLVYKLATLEPPPDGGASDIRDFTQRIVAQWEEWVRAYPEQWRWIHWRWKTRPDGTEEQYRGRDFAACFDDNPPVPGTSRRQAAETYERSL